MTLQFSAGHFSAGASLFGLGTAGLAMAATRKRDVTLKPLSALLLGAGLVLMSSAAHADQFKQAADNARIECEVSRRELTRIALVGDQFASVSKISSGNPYSDFAVSNEPVRGDLYLSVPPAFAGADISFFATSKKGYVYKFACRTADIDAQQVFITNPGLVASDAADWENETTPADAAIRLVHAMAGEETVPGFVIRQAAGIPARVGPISVQRVAEYQGAALSGQMLRVTNLGRATATLREADIAPPATLAISLTATSLKAGEAATAFVVTQSKAN
jgi:conjugal transfer pilus assembly protein TraK